MLLPDSGQENSPAGLLGGLPAPSKAAGHGWLDKWLPQITGTRGLFARVAGYAIYLAGW